MDIFLMRTDIDIGADHMLASIYITLKHKIIAIDR